MAKKAKETDLKPASGELEAAPAAAPTPEKGFPCRYQADRDTIVDAEAFGVDAETGTAERVEGIVNGRFKRFKGVRATGALTAGVIDSVGCYALPEKAGVGR